MDIFICKTVEGKIVPQQSLQKVQFFNKLINSYGQLDKAYKVTIELVEKNINESQKSLYKAFILKVSEHLGYSYKNTEDLLLNEDSIKNVKPFHKWTTKDLNEFIDKSSALLAEYGFNFEKT